jgi:sn-glycerol 3-phosphate transport system substrate-binding protein
VRTRTRAATLIAASLIAAAGAGLGGVAANASSDKIEIGVSIAFTDDRLDWANDVAAAFEANHPEFDVVITGYDDYESLLQAATLAADQGDPPAIAQYFEVATQQARDAVTADGEPLFASVGEAIGDRTEILGEPVVINDIVDAAANYYKVDGVFTSMPWNTSSTLLYANNGLLEAAGVAAVPETWADIEAACEAIMGAEGAPTACITWPNHGWFFEQSIAQQGGLFVNNDNGRTARADEVLVNSDEMLSFVDYWKSLADAGYYTYTGTQRDWDGTVNAFTAQEVAFILTSSGDAGGLVTSTAEAGFEMTVSRMPYNQDAEYAGNLIGGATLWLVNGLDEQTSDGALAFMQFLDNPENAASWHQTTGYIPITNASVALLEEQGWFDENPWARVATDQLAMADGSPAASGAILGSFVETRDIVTQAMEDILVSGADPVERFAEAQDEAQAALEDYNDLYATEG